MEVSIITAWILLNHILIETVLLMMVEIQNMKVRFNYARIRWEKVLTETARHDSAPQKPIVCEFNIETARLNSTKSKLTNIHVNKVTIVQVGHTEAVLNAHVSKNSCALKDFPVMAIKVSANTHYFIHNFNVLRCIFVSRLHLHSGIYLHERLQIIQIYILHVTTY